MRLAFDTSTAAVTVAVADGPQVLAESTTVDARRHGELLMPAIEAVLLAAGVGREALTEIAVGVGPGPFTGLRVGLVTARTLAMALGLPLVGVCSLDLVAYESGLAGPLRVVADARRREVYWAAYDGVVRVEGPAVGPACAVGRSGPVLGARLFAEVLGEVVGPEYPSAASLSSWVAAGLPTLPPDPLYLRRPDAVAPGPRKPVTT